MAARLQHALHDIAVPKGTFLIGRGSDCQLSLDDALVSRRHAMIRVEECGSAVLEDLESRNGVFLNGVRVTKPEPLADGDQIRIGSQDIGFFLSEDTELTRPRAMRVTMQEVPQMSVPPSTIEAQRAEGTKPRQASTAFDEPGPLEPTAFMTAPLNTMRAASGLVLIGGVADKALALGRAEEAERILQRALSDVMDRAPKGEVDAELAERASGYAVRLAAATGRGAWIDYIVRLYLTSGLLIPARIVDELYHAVRRTKRIDKALLRAYLAHMKDVSGTFGPAERFVQQRIEGLERSSR